MSFEYSDIIDLEYPLKNHNNVKHPRMNTGERAKIFAPFAALKGYEEAIEEAAERKNYAKSQ